MGLQAHKISIYDYRLFKLLYYPHYHGLTCRVSLLEISLTNSSPLQAFYIMNIVLKLLEFKNNILHDEKAFKSLCFSVIAY